MEISRVRKAKKHTTPEKMKAVAKKSLVLAFRMIFTIFVRILVSIRFDSIRRFAILGYWSAKGLVIGNNVSVRPNVVIRHPESVVIGDDVSINEFVHIWGKGGIDIGSKSMIASHCVLTSQTHTISEKFYCETLECKPIKIGANVWIGAGSILLPGVSVGDNAVIGAGSVVNKNIDANCVVAGVPAVVIRTLN